LTKEKKSSANTIAHLEARVAFASQEQTELGVSFNGQLEILNEKLFMTHTEHAKMQGELKKQEDNTISILGKLKDENTTIVAGLEMRIQNVEGEKNSVAASLKAQVGALNDKTASLQGENDELKQQLVRNEEILKQDAAANTAKLADLERRTIRADEQKNEAAASVSSQLEDLNVTVSNLQEGNLKLQEELHLKEKHLEVLQQDKLASESKLMDLEKRVSGVEEEKTRISASLTEELGARCDQNSIFQQENVKLRGQVKEYEAMVNILEHTIEVSSAKTAELQTKLADLERRTIRADEQKNEAAASMSSQLEDLNVTVSNLQEGNLKQQEELHLKEKHLEALQQDKLASESKLMDLEKRVAGVEEEKTRISASLTEQLGARCDQNIIFQQENAKLRGQVKENEATVNILKHTIEESSAKTAELETRVELLEIEKNQISVALEEQLKHLHNKMSTAQEENSRLKAELEQKKGQVTALQGNKEENDSTLANMETRVRSIEKAKNDVTSSLTSQVEVLNGNVSNLQEKSLELEVQLRQKAQEVEQSNSAHEETITTLEKRVKYADGKRVEMSTSFNRDLNLLKEKVTFLQEENDTLKRQLEQEKDEVAPLALSIIPTEGTQEQDGLDTSLDSIDENDFLPLEFTAAATHETEGLADDGATTESEDMDDSFDESLFLPTAMVTSSPVIASPKKVVQSVNKSMSKSVKRAPLANVGVNNQTPSDRPMKSARKTGLVSSTQKVFSTNENSAPRALHFL
jgi:chromosome segregation ATPase